jgi:hypothetical protein
MNITMFLVWRVWLSPRVSPFAGMKSVRRCFSPAAHAGARRFCDYTQERYPGMLIQLSEAGRLVKSACLLFIPFVLMFVQSNDLYAATKEETARIGVKEPEVSCPSQDFYEFFNAFSRNEDVQRAFTKMPLRKKQFNFAKNPKSRHVIHTLSRQQIQFPVMPLEWSWHGIYTGSCQPSMKVIGRCDPEIKELKRRAIVNIHHNEHQLFYEFLQTDTCWKLVGIDDRTVVSESGEIIQNWLEEWIVFDRGLPCDLGGLFYDRKIKRSHPEILEKRGYLPYKVDEYTAHYKINEKFLGLDAVEIAIPYNDSILAITVSADVRKLSDTVFKRKGRRLQVATPGFKAKSGVAYLASVGDGKSQLVCYTFEE